MSNNNLPASATYTFMLNLSENNPELFGGVHGVLAPIPEMFVEQAQFTHPQWNKVGYDKFQILGSELMDDNRLFDISIPGCRRAGEGYCIDIAIRCYVDTKTRKPIALKKGEQGNSGQWWSVRTSGTPIYIDERIVQAGLISPELYGMLDGYPEHIEEFERTYGKNMFGYGKENSEGLIFLMPEDKGSFIQFELETRLNPKKMEYILGIKGKDDLKNTSAVALYKFKPLNASSAAYEMDVAPAPMPPLVPAPTQAMPQTPAQPAGFTRPGVAPTVATNKRVFG